MAQTRPAPTIGHNRPPEPIETTFVTSDPAALAARLARDYAATVERFTELEIGAKKVPAKIATEAVAKETVARQQRNKPSWMSLWPRRGSILSNAIPFRVFSGCPNIIPDWHRRATAPSC